MRPLILASLVAVVSAHFQLQFPAPRGQFVEDNEPFYCDGYNSTTSNRTEFPLSNGFFSLNSEHPSWTVAVYLANKSNPTSFADFNQITPFLQLEGEGLFCLPLGFTSPNATGLQNGENVTIQILYDGGDGNLYQCADLTLASNFSIAPSVTCTNATNTTSTSSGGGSGSDGTRLDIPALALLLSLLLMIFGA